ncbi:MAG: class I SAM-dependent methyltransferase [Acidobacteriota bacterium]
MIGVSSPLAEHPVPSKNKKRKNKHPKTADTVDRHRLYEKAVQCPEADLRFARRMFRRHQPDRPLLDIREDFCGTALLACEWVAGGKDRRAFGVDLDGDTLDWGREHNLSPLGKAAKRVTLVEGNVLDAKVPKVDLTLALNFSYFCFTERRDLVAYYSAARAGLRSGGLFVMDIFGGTEAMDTSEEKTKKDGFTFVWEQAKFNPINHAMRCHIHFHFRDGSKLHRAFSYQWRFWTVPEIRDCLLEAGFEDVEFYWEGFDEDGDGNGIFRRVKNVEQAEGFIAYIVATT